MAATIFTRNTGMRLAHLVLLALLALGIAALDLRMIHARGLISEAAQPIQMADDILRSGVWPHTAFYPPMLTWLALALRSVGLQHIDPYAFNLAFLIAGLAAAYALARRVCANDWHAFLACMLILLNPYFIWTILLSRDSAVEFLFLALVLWSCLALTRPVAPLSIKAVGWLSLLLLDSAIALSLTRVTGFFMSLAVLAVAYLLSTFAEHSVGTASVRRSLMYCGGALLLFGGLWAGYNYQQVGAFTLATNGGYNLYLGNHPAFLHAYPHYDLDVFLRSQDLSGSEAPDEAETDRLYRRAAIGFIRADPAAFAYRTIMKSAWYWFSLDKLPNYTTDSMIISPPSAAEWTARLLPVNILPSLAYVLYRLAYLPALFVSVIALYRKLMNRGFAIVFAPLLGLWPIVALTFPDTRFKLSAEALTLPLLVAACFALWRAYRPGLRARAGGSDQE